MQILYLRDCKISHVLLTLYELGSTPTYYNWVGADKSLLSNPRGCCPAVK